LLAEARGDINLALQGKEAANIQESLLSAMDGMIGQIESYKSEINRIDLEEQWDNQLLQTAQTDLQGASQQFLKELQRAEELSGEKQIINPLYEEVLNKIALAEQAVEISSDLAKQGKEMLDQIIEQRIEQRKIRKKMFWNKILGIISQVAGILSTVLMILSPAFPALIPFSIALGAVSGAINTIQAVINGDWMGAIFSGVMTGLSAVTGGMTQALGESAKAVVMMKTLQAGAFNGARSIMSGESIMGFLQILGSVASAASAGMSSFINQCSGTLKNVMLSVVQSLQQAPQMIYSGIKSIQSGDWLNAIGNFFNGALAIGQSFAGNFNTAVAGILENISKVGNTALYLGNAIKDGGIEGWLSGIGGILGLWKNDLMGMVDKISGKEECVVCPPQPESDPSANGDKSEENKGEKIEDGTSKTQESEGGISEGESQLKPLLMKAELIDDKFREEKLKQLGLPANTSREILCDEDMLNLVEKRADSTQFYKQEERIKAVQDIFPNLSDQEAANVQLTDTQIYYRHEEKFPSQSVSSGPILLTRDPKTGQVILSGQAILGAGSVQTGQVIETENSWQNKFLENLLDWFGPHQNSEAIISNNLSARMPELPPELLDLVFKPLYEKMPDLIIFKMLPDAVVRWEYEKVAEQVAGQAAGSVIGDLLGSEIANDLLSLTNPNSPFAPFPSGSDWVKEFPNDNNLNHLSNESGFRDGAINFIDALRDAGAIVDIQAVIRPEERAWLMYYAWQIAHNHIKPENVPKYDGIPIDWTHNGNEAEAIKAAKDMVAKYGIITGPADPKKGSNHIPTKKRAIDMSIKMPSTGQLTINGGDGQQYTITAPKGTLLDLNQTLFKLGESYGVYHYGYQRDGIYVNPGGDHVHWSSNGR
jgi:hypothetical protein